jgi:outer membrane protein OmpA-like peptidoglycan-associated protein
MRNKFSLILLSACLYAFAISSGAHEGVLKDPSGKFITDIYGECISVGELKHYHTDEEKSHCGVKPKKAVKKEPPPKPKPKPKVVKQSVVIEAKVLFDFDSDEVKPEGKQYIEEIRQKYRFFTADSIEIIGHTDSSGPEAYNQGLSERRSASVKKYLVETGSDAGKIRTSGRGETQPVADNGTEEGRQKNRRVEITVEATEQ